jgi:hypothetical protein
LAARNRHVAGGGIDLPGAGPVEGALLVAGRAHGLAAGAVALHRAAAQRGRDLAAGIFSRHRQRGRGHAERLGEALILQRGDRRVVAALQREPQKREARVGIDELLAGLVPRIRLPGVEITNKVGERVLALVPGLDLLGRAGEARGVARELAERDPFDVAAALKLGHVFRHGIVERDVALLDRLRKQGRDEHLADRGEVEEGVAGDGPPRRGVAEVHEQGAAVDMDRDRHAARSFSCLRLRRFSGLRLRRGEHGLDLLRDHRADLGVGLGEGERGGEGGGHDHRRHCQRIRYTTHRFLLPSSGASEGPYRLRGLYPCVRRR